MEIAATKTPAHETVYRFIRDMILFGDLAPGEAVTIQGLAAGLDCSMTPVREAIRRLTAEGALEFQGNRRVLVPQMGANRFRELVFARDAIEPRLAEMAARNDPGDLAERLKAIDLQLDAAIDSGDVQGYMRHNCRFHFTLYRQAGSHILMPLVETLWLRSGPLSRIICGRHGTANLVDLHDEAMRQLRRKNPEGVAEAIRGDLEQGFSIVRRVNGWR